MVADVFRLPHEMNSQPQRSQDVLAGSGNVRPRHRGFVSGARQFKSAFFCIGQDALAVHGDQVAIGEETQITRFVGRSRDFGSSNDLKSPLDAFHQFD